MKQLSLCASGAVLALLGACSSTTNTTASGSANTGTTAGTSGSSSHAVTGGSSGAFKGVAGSALSAGGAALSETRAGNGGTAAQARGGSDTATSSIELEHTGGAGGNSLSGISGVSAIQGAKGGAEAAGGSSRGGSAAITRGGANQGGSNQTLPIGGTLGSPAGGSSPATAGAPAVGGKTTTIGGSPSVGASSAAKGGVNQSGASSTAETAAGGTAGSSNPSVGGTSIAGGKKGCSEPADCVNPHAPTCVMSCDAGTCKGAVSTSLGVAPQSGPKDGTPRTGVWTSGNTPYVLYPCLDYVPACVKIQPLDADGAMSAQPAVLDLPEGLTTADAITAGVNSNKLGVIWHSARTTDSMTVTALALTTFSGGNPSQLIVLKEETLNSPYPDRLDTAWLEPLGTDSWGIVLQGGAHEYAWRGAVMSASSPPSSPPFSGDGARLFNSPYTISARSSLKRPPQAAAVVNNTLFVTGLDVQWAGLEPTPMLVIGRYDARSMTSLSSMNVSLALSSYPNEDGYLRTPAIGKLGNRLAALWTEYTPTKSILLGRVVFNEDGTTATSRTAVPSVLIPKAVVETPTGAAMLVASRLDETATPATHTVVVQRLDANLEFVGSAYAINTPSTVEPSGVTARLSTDGRVLVTFRQDYAQHRIVHAELCR